MKNGWGLGHMHSSYIYFGKPASRGSPAYRQLILKIWSLARTKKEAI